jgi:hypothetical protein
VPRGPTSTHRAQTHGNFPPARTGVVDAASQTRSMLDLPRWVWRVGVPICRDAGARCAAARPPPATSSGALRHRARPPRSRGSSNTSRGAKKLPARRRRAQCVAWLPAPPDRACPGCPDKRILALPVFPNWTSVWQDTMIVNRQCPAAGGRGYIAAHAASIASTHRARPAVQMRRCGSRRDRCKHAL